MPPTDEIPLTEATYFILLSLADAPRHGYAILKDVEALSQARIVFSTGTLYGALKRLLDLGWIKRADDAGREPDTGRPRKAYTLTDVGRRVLGAEVTRLKHLVKAARRRAVRDAA
ncbi:MAG TPA: PadR family transcriptional regulator [Anaerolineales bacterium]|nr:PadR family transcriptional regulator [Anaerolineales bacterium]HRF46435.1 PadR family transcriptional regulator [Anaerolineales bacterium]